MEDARSYIGAVLQVTFEVAGDSEPETAPRRIWPCREKECTEGPTTTILVVTDFRD
ncbi:hypothetical protein BY454_1434 [Marinobacter persicus]|uniref:Uncharacterized protein n=1 Tax=Marinobacter persicus TaxID=930118 RepID=A0A2S6G2C4_9GAMM|nr:hypothetical protein BY455_1424 [Marinobacter persicus]PPK51600.1 hypothetical protein B0H24_104311 [Marinobacter persicus]PPK56254.1 hypothetical protein BY454_1434 [Marinobacter persicus]